ncbi:Cytochrome c heme lyase subunit CcmH [hydrothermal vent metagenome]|uniref:Cytochrome c heme lyase subunit CcmH n=1 Tax=hydrothermal vent metagenome TaxID=652676 RepID=A0A3B0WCL6_9ZZZZ
MILMLLVAIGALVFPVLKVRQSSAVAYKDSNLKINDEKIAELDLDLKEGRINQHYYKAAREELDRELLIDIPVESKDTAALHYTGTAKRHPALALMIAIFIPMLALLLYLDMGMHAASEDDFVAGQPSVNEQASIEEMTQALEAKIEKDGGTLQDWIMLGRAHKHMGNHSQAANAFAVVLEKDSDNAQVMLEQAEMLALMNNRKFNAESRALISRAYALQPDNPNTLWFTGVAEYQAKNYRTAIDRLRQLLPLARGDEDVIKSVIAIVAKSRDALIESGEEMPELAELLAIEGMMAEDVSSRANVDGNEQRSEVSTIATRLQVTVNVSEAVKQKFNANDVVFVYAKAKQGPRMPLAAQRLTLGALPATIILDDSMAMVEGMNLSAFEQLQVSARLSQSGSAIAQSGDYIGQQSVDRSKTSATDIALTIQIEKLVP